MKNTLRNLSVLFLILLSACFASNQQDSSPTVGEAPIVVSTELPTETASIATPTVMEVIQTPTRDHAVLLSKLLPNCSDPEFSPNQTWAAGFCDDDETWIVSADQTATWMISYGEYYGNKFNSGNGVIAPFHWTSDDNYLYLTIQRGASGPVYFVDGWGLIRLDLANGNVIEVLSPIQQKYYSFSLSPDEQYVAYIVQPAKPLTVNIIHLESKNTKKYYLRPDYNQAGEMLWSSDMSKIVLGQAMIDVQETQPNSFSVTAIDLANDFRQLLLTDSEVQMNPKTWIDEYTLELSDTEGKVWVYNFIDQTLLEKTE